MNRESISGVMLLFLALGGIGSCIGCGISQKREFEAAESRRQEVLAIERKAYQKAAGDDRILTTQETRALLDKLGLERIIIEYDDKIRLDASLSNYPELKISPYVIINPQNLGRKDSYRIIGTPYSFSLDKLKAYVEEGK